MQRKRRRWWTRLVTVVATLTILAASISVLFQLALDAMPGYRVEIEQFVARSVGHPARIGGIALTWSRLRPTLELRNIALFDGASGVTLLEARRLRLGFGIGRLIRGRRDPSRIEIVALQLYADVDAAGRWSLRGFQPTGFTDWHVLAADLGRFDDRFAAAAARPAPRRQRHAGAGICAAQRLDSSRRQPLQSRRGADSADRDGAAYRHQRGAFR